MAVFDRLEKVGYPPELWPEVSITPLGALGLELNPRPEGKFYGQLGYDILNAGLRGLAAKENGHRAPRLCTR